MVYNSPSIVKYNLSGASILGLAMSICQYNYKRESRWEIRGIALCVLHILGFSVLSIILADLLGNTYLLARVQKVMFSDS